MICREEGFAPSSAADFPTNRLKQNNHETNITLSDDTGHASELMFERRQGLVVAYDDNSYRTG
jgi:ABC-type uncharacterized transport system involved in gliding motility auxiliary subunit